MSTIKVNAIQDTAGVERYTARAWVNFNGAGTVAIRAGGNVSSITDNGTGDYTVNFTVAMPDSNYATALGSQPNAGALQAAQINNASSPSTSNVRILTHQSGVGNVDVPIISVAIFR